MLDLHCHILPGVDDGAKNLDESLAMARLCVRDGITHVVATPHCHRHCRMLRADVLPHVVRLNQELASANIPLTVLPAGRGGWERPDLSGRSHLIEIVHDRFSFIGHRTERSAVGMFPSHKGAPCKRHRLGWIGD